MRIIKSRDIDQGDRSKKILESSSKQSLPDVRQNKPNRDERRRLEREQRENKRREERQRFR